MAEKREVHQCRQFCSGKYTVKGSILLSINA